MEFTIYLEILPLTLSDELSKLSLELAKAIRDATYLGMTHAEFEMIERAAELHHPEAFQAKCP